MKLWNPLTVRITSDHFDGAIGPLVCYVAAVAFLALGFRRLSTLPLSSGEAFLGVLALLAVGLLVICVGLLLQVLHVAKQARDERKG